MQFTMPYRSPIMPRASLLLICLIFLCIIPGHSAAASATNSEVAISNLIAQAKAKNLSSDRYWHALVHYRKQSFSIERRSRSTIISPEFFLASDGNINPESELEATVASFFQPVEADSNRHPQCRFVARYRWLHKMLDWHGLAIPKPKCSQFEQWSLDGHIDSLSLVFATGYLSNPASLYGHMMLKFNAAGSTAANELLDSSMSYGALVPPHENGLVYVTKGLLGGYDAGFSHEKFFRHNHNYTEIDLRDLWEYQLDLNNDEVEQIVAHSWELTRVKFTYYFFSENCAYRVAELLQLVIDKPLLPNTPWSIPSTVFNKLAAIQRDNKPLIAHIRRIPSRQNRFYAKYFALTQGERDTVRQKTKNTEKTDEEHYSQQSSNSKIKITETLFDYYEFRAANERDLNKFRQEKQAILAERLQLPAESPSWPDDHTQPPHVGQPPLLLQVSALNNSDWGNGAEIRVRPAYYDLLSLNAGRLPHSRLSMFDLRAAYIDNAFRFRSLEFVGIETLNLSRTGLEGDGGNAWKVRFGFEQQDLNCHSCTIFSVDGGVGKAIGINDRASAFAMIEGRLQSTADDSGMVATTGRIGFLLDADGMWKSEISLGARRYIDQAQGTEPLVRWENRFGTRRDIDFRLTYEKNVAHEIKGSVLFYW